MSCHPPLNYELVAVDEVVAAENDAFVVNVAGWAAAVEDEADLQSLNELDGSWEFDLH